MLDETSLSKEQEGVGDINQENGEEDELSGGFVSSGEEDEEIAAAAAAVDENGRDEEMEEIMEQMDRELGVTEIGKSFEKMKVSLQRSYHSQCGIFFIGPFLDPFQLLQYYIESCE